MNATKQKLSLKWSFILLGGWSTILIFFIYHVYFEKHFKAQSVITEIESLQIDSTKSFQYSFDDNTTYYEFWIGGKYKVDVEATKSQPFQSKDRQEVYVRDIDGNLVMSYDTKYHYKTLNCWESDYIQLMKYLNIQHR
jgi:hypothetical protein